MFGFGASGYNVLLSSYFNPSKGYKGSAVSKANGTNIVPCIQKTNKQPHDEFITVDIIKYPNSVESDAGKNLEIIQSRCKLESIMHLRHSIKKPKPKRNQFEALSNKSGIGYFSKYMTSNIFH